MQLNQTRGLKILSFHMLQRFLRRGWRELATDRAPNSESPDLPLPGTPWSGPIQDHGLRPWSQIPLWAQKTRETKGFLGLQRPFLDLVSQTLRPRGRGRPLFADKCRTKFFPRVVSTSPEGGTDAWISGIGRISSRRPLCPLFRNLWYVLIRTTLPEHLWDTPELSGHYSRDRSESVNVIGVISEPFALWIYIAHSENENDCVNSVFSLRKKHEWTSKKTCGNSGKKNTWNNFAVGGCPKFVHVFFFQVIPFRGEKHINKIPPRSRDNLVKILFRFLNSLAFLAGNCAEKPIYWAPIWMGGAVTIPTQKVGKLQK